jgi:hypothetical protein
MHRPRRTVTEGGKGESCEGASSLTIYVNPRFAFRNKISKMNLVAMTLMVSQSYDCRNMDCSEHSSMTVIQL